MWINYSPNDNGIDRRITQFFIDGFNEGMAVYEKKMQEIYAREHKDEIERGEKEELKRLQEKYLTPPKK